MPTHWLRYDRSDHCWGMFREESMGQMRVRACLGGSTVIECAMPREDARTLWTRLRNQDWHQPTAEEITSAGMSPEKLLHIIRERQRNRPWRR